MSSGSVSASPREVHQDAARFAQINRAGVVHHVTALHGNRRVAVAARHPAHREHRLRALLSSRECGRISRAIRSGTSFAAGRAFRLCALSSSAVISSTLRGDFGARGFLLSLDAGEFVVLAVEHAAQLFEAAVDGEQVALFAGDDLSRLFHLRDGRGGHLHVRDGIHLRLIPFDQLLVLGEFVAEPRLFLFFGRDGSVDAPDRIECALFALIEFADSRFEGGHPLFESVYDNIVSLQRQQ